MELIQQIWLGSFIGFGVCGFIAAGLHEHAGRWGIGSWYPWVPTYIKVILATGMLLPFIPLIVLFGALFLLMDVHSNWRRGMKRIVGLIK